jgi:amidohydrolase
MPIVNRIADFAADMTAWRRHMHTNPEINFDCHDTAAFVVEQLRSFGITDIHTGIATSGVVAVIEGQGESDRVLGLRADFDALPMDEMTGLEYASTRPGAMHACGHDGHTTMLLGAARYLAETRNFAGRIVLVFQPAEEGGGGAGVMVEEGVLDRFGITEVYALHNLPGLEEGHFLTNSGPVMAAVDTFRIQITGVGGHAAMPHDTKDPISALLGISNALQTIVSRNHRAVNELVVSITQVHAGSAENVIPESAQIIGTVRTFDPEVQDMVERRMNEITQGYAAAHEVQVELDYERGYPATVNEKTATAFAVSVAQEISGEAGVNSEAEREMGAEDFSYFLENRPGSYLFLGQGSGPGLHHPGYDFNDDIAPIGASFFARLVETAQQVR